MVDKGSLHISRVVRTERRRNPQTGEPYPWLVESTAMVNHYYFYCVDRDFGLFFLKLGSYFPYNGKACLNGHEYLKCQLRQEGASAAAGSEPLRPCPRPESASDSDFVQLGQGPPALASDPASVHIRVNFPQSESEHE